MYKNYSTQLLEMAGILAWVGFSCVFFAHFRLSEKMRSLSVCRVWFLPHFSTSSAESASRQSTSWILRDFLASGPPPSSRFSPFVNVHRQIRVGLCHADSLWLIQSLMLPSCSHKGETSSKKNTWQSHILHIKHQVLDISNTNFATFCFKYKIILQLCLPQKVIS